MSTELNNEAQALNKAPAALSTDKHEVPERLADNEDLVDRLEGAGKAAVKVAASTVVATTLANTLAQPPRVELITLPEPTPIVQVYQDFDEVAEPDEDDEQDESESRWRRILRLLKYLLITLALVGAILLGVLKGCAGIAGTLLPQDDDRQEQTTQQTQTEDERGAAVASQLASEACKARR